MVEAQDVEALCSPTRLVLAPGLRRPLSSLKYRRQAQPVKANPQSRSGPASVSRSVSGPDAAEVAAAENVLEVLAVNLLPNSTATCDSAEGAYVAGATEDQRQRSAACRYAESGMVCDGEYLSVRYDTTQAAWGKGSRLLTRMLTDQATGTGDSNPGDEQQVRATVDFR